MNTKKFALLISYICSRTGREFSMNEVESIYQQVEAMPDQPMNYLHQGSIEQMHLMLEAMQAGRKIDAIEAHKQLTGYGLKESKDAIEKYWIGNNLSDTRLVKDIQYALGTNEISQALVEVARKARTAELEYRCI